MAGSITVSSITLDSDNNFSIKSNTGATLFFANTSGIDVANSIGATAITNDKILSVANTKISGNIISSQIAPSVTLTTPIISGNLNLDSAGTTGIRVPTANTIAFYGAGTEDMRITSAGDVGIGTSSPGAKLDVVGQALVGGVGNNAIAINSSGSNYGFISNPSAGVFALGYGTTIGTLGTSVATWNSSGNFAFNSGYGSVATAYGCRAWVNFNGQGTVAIRASGNVSSITDNSVGNYFINFTTAMPDGNYSAVGSAFDNGVTCFASFTTSSVGVYTRLIQTGSFPTGGVDDYSVVSAAIFR